MRVQPAGPPYHGGKNPRRWPVSTGQWIADLLPWDKEQTYAEPFGGMFGVGFCRRPVKREIWNDTNERLANYWRVWQEQPQEMIWQVQQAVWSRTLFEQDKERLDKGTPIQRAAALHRVLSHSMLHSDSHANRLATFGGRNTWELSRCNAVADRMRDVEIENRDALELLRSLPAGPTCCYVDPPYAGTTGYGNGVDKALLTELLLAQTQPTAISGYGKEWDVLGWEKSGLGQVNSLGAADCPPTTEVLWTNFTALPDPQTALF